jgi:hypothetical protein
MGGNLSMALVVLTQLAPSPREASAYTGWRSWWGTCSRRSGPVALGTLTDATGGFTVPFLALAVFGGADGRAWRGRPDAPPRSAAGSRGLDRGRSSPVQAVWWHHNSSKSPGPDVRSAS